jgi:hypothetical protein
MGDELVELDGVTVFDNVCKHCSLDRGADVADDEAKGCVAARSVAVV